MQQGLPCGKAARLRMQVCESRISKVGLPLGEMSVGLLGSDGRLSKWVLEVKMRALRFLVEGSFIGSFGRSCEARIWTGSCWREI